MVDILFKVFKVLNLTKRNEKFLFLEHSVPFSKGVLQYFFCKFENENNVNSEMKTKARSLSMIFQFRPAVLCRFPEFKAGKIRVICDGCSSGCDGL